MLLWKSPTSGENKLINAAITGAPAMASLVAVMKQFCQRSSLSLVHRCHCAALPGGYCTSPYTNQWPVPLLIADNCQVILQAPNTKPLLNYVLPVPCCVNDTRPREHRLPAQQQTTPLNRHHHPWHPLSNNNPPPNTHNISSPMTTTTNTHKQCIYKSHTHTKNHIDHRHRSSSSSSFKVVLLLNDRARVPVAVIHADPRWHLLAERLELLGDRYHSVGHRVVPADDIVGDR